MVSATERRLPLSRERIFDAAIALADREGLSALTMRQLAQELDVEAMSLYHHVANKEALLDGVVDRVVGEINAAVGRLDGPRAEDDWRGSLRGRILTAREVLLEHPWASEVIATRAGLSPAVMRYFEGVLATLRAGGFSWDLAHHALHALGSRALGFTQELFAPDGVAVTDADLATAFDRLATELPNLSAMLGQISHDPADPTLGWCDDQTEFEFGLDVLLDGLARRRGD